MVECEFDIGPKAISGKRLLLIFEKNKTTKGGSVQLEIASQISRELLDYDI